jgi:hypothetical protein
MTPSSEIEIQGQQVVVTGHRGAGKSTLVQMLLRQTGAHFVYDYGMEHDEYNRYLPEHRRGDELKAEVDGVIGKVVVDNTPSRRPAIVVLEEANRYVPNRGTIPESVAELVDMGRHYKTAASQGITVIYTTRRPSQLDTDVMELADYLMVYRTRGRNDRERLNQEAAGLGDAAADLDDYHWLLVRPDRTYQTMKPVPPGDTTGEL